MSAINPNQIKGQYQTTGIEFGAGGKSATVSGTWTIPPEGVRSERTINVSIEFKGTGVNERQVGDLYALAAQKFSEALTTGAGVNNPIKLAYQLTLDEKGEIVGADKVKPELKPDVFEQSRLRQKAKGSRSPSSGDVSPRVSPREMLKEAKGTSSAASITFPPPPPPPRSTSVPSDLSRRPVTQAEREVHSAPVSPREPVTQAAKAPKSGSVREQARELQKTQREQVLSLIAKSADPFNVISRERVFGEKNEPLRNILNDMHANGAVGVVPKPSKTPKNSLWTVHSPYTDLLQGNRRDAVRSGEVTFEALQLARGLRACKDAGVVPNISKETIVYDANAKGEGVNTVFIGREALERGSLDQDNRTIAPWKQALSNLANLFEQMFKGAAMPKSVADLVIKMKSPNPEPHIIEEAVATLDAELGKTSPALYQIYEDL